MALLVAGMGSYAYAENACQASLTETVIEDITMSPTNPTETERQVLKKAAPILEIVYSELLAMFQHGEATIEQNEDGNWVVTAYLASGGTVIAVLGDIL
jgi:hypothetical protein